jgi:hypothetical protein
MLKANMAAADALTFLNSSALSPNPSGIPIRGVVAAFHYWMRTVASGFRRIQPGIDRATA